MLEAKAKSPELHIPSVKICGFDINVEREMLSTNMKFTIAGSREYVCEAGITDKQDNVQRIVNLLEKTIPKRIEDTKKEIVFFESNIQQAEEKELPHRSRKNRSFSIKKLNMQSLKRA